MKFIEGDKLDLSESRKLFSKEKFKPPNFANNIANAITSSRILMTPAFALCVLYSDKIPSLNSWAIFLVVLTIISDCTDGAIARKWGSATALGTFLDPVADKICIDTAFIVISIKYDFPLWATFIVVSRDLFVLGSWAFFLLVSNESYIVVPHIFGKLMVTFQLVTLILVLSRAGQAYITWGWRITIFFSLASLLVYMIDLNAYRRKV